MPVMRLPSTAALRDATLLDLHACAVRISPLVLHLPTATSHNAMSPIRSLLALIGVASALSLTACGGNRDAADSAPAAAVATPSAGQVAPVPSTPQLTVYAASRFAEQASFGPTPALVAEIRAKGLSQWIDDQFALPASQIDTSSYQSFVDPIPDSEWSRYRSAFPNLAVGAADQLRLRLTWSLSQFITTSDRKGDLVGAVYWINMLQRQALGRYDDLLYQTSVSPYMAQFLDNDQNRPKSAECNSCAPNENFARELMQLFSIGVAKLNADGTPQRDSRGRGIETYTQKDVEELARVLTGWEHDPQPPGRPNRNWANWSKPMVATTWPPLRDAGAKLVLGRSFAAAQSQDKDLRDAIALLMGHQNIAPFVATRLIQHLVKSNPTPAYVGRIAAKFINNGSGVKGDLKAMTKAVLLDPEARAGDVPSAARSDDGKLREPMLHRMAAWRGLGCSATPKYNWGGVAAANVQPPFGPESVFSFYAPTDRAPGSNLLAPEQKLMTANELTDRLAVIDAPRRWDGPTQTNDLSRYRDAGCQIDALISIYAQGTRPFLDFISERYFRGAMPPTLRTNVETIINQPNPPWNKAQPSEGPLRMLGFALATPYYGVIK